MKTAVVFGVEGSLDFQEVRLAVSRIPEVSLRLDEAQRAWDKTCSGVLSFKHYLSSDNSLFYNNINLKNLVHAIVQIGLFDRYVRKNGQPDLIIGNSKNDAATKVATGQMSLSEMIAESQACALIRPLSHLTVASPEPVLKGQSLPEFIICERSIDEKDAKIFKAIGTPSSSLEAIIKTAIEDKNANKIVHVGPGIEDKLRRSAIETSEDVQWLESIDIDPMLNWFWTELRKLEIPMSRAQ